MSEPPGDARRHAPAAARNRAPILAVLARLLPPRGEVLEIASGSGEHAAAIAAAFPGLRVQPSDPDPAARASIDAWAATAGLGNLAPALALDVTAEPWPAGPVVAVLCINMIHIAPWAATVGLMRGAAQVLRPGGVLYLYGPYRRAGVPTAPSNAAFDGSLRSSDPRWGLRDLEAVTACAAAHGLLAEAVEEMPANNLSVVFRRGEVPVSPPAAASADT